MKKTILAAILCLNGLTAVAQSARTVLDRTAARITQSGCIRSQFKATQFRGTTPESEATGTMLVSGRKFHMQTSDIISWFDGKTLWSMMPGSGEVNISEPTDDELVGMNPSTFIHLYKKGYNYSLRTSTLRGKPTYEVRLRAKSKKASFSESRPYIFYYGTLQGGTLFNALQAPAGYGIRALSEHTFS